MSYASLTAKAALLFRYFLKPVFPTVQIHTRRKNSFLFYSTNSLNALYCNLHGGMRFLQKIDEKNLLKIYACTTPGQRLSNAEPC